MEPDYKLICFNTLTRKAIWWHISCCNKINHIKLKIVQKATTNSFNQKCLNKKAGKFFNLKLDAKILIHFRSICSSLNFHQKEKRDDSQASISIIQQPQGFNIMKLNGLVNSTLLMKMTLLVTFSPVALWFIQFIS